MKRPVYIYNVLGKAKKKQFLHTKKSDTMSTRRSVVWYATGEGSAVVVSCSLVIAVNARSCARILTALTF